MAPAQDGPSRKNLSFTAKLVIFLLTNLFLAIAVINFFWYSFFQSEINFIPNSLFSHGLPTNEFMVLLGFQLLILGMIMILQGIFIFNKLIKPLDNLTKAINHLGQGNLNHQIPTDGKGEIGKLTQAFNSLSLNLSQAFKKLSQDHQIISAEKSKLEIALSGVADGVIGLDLNSNIILFNKAAENITGYSLSQVMGKPIDQMIKIYNKDQEIPSSIYCPLNPDNPNLNYKKEGLQMIGFNNKQTIVNLISAKISHGTTNNLGCLMILHNVTKEKELEEMQVDFVSMAAHELRTPLTSIRGYLSVLLEENQQKGPPEMMQHKFTPEQEMFLTRINISAGQLMSLVENLLSVSRIERGVFSVNLEQIDWVSMAKQLTVEQKDRAADKKIDLEFINPTQPLPPVMADKIRVGEVLTNLVTNAIKYTQPGGEVKVWLELKDKMIITHVKDTGEGIPQEALPNLFKKFFRVNRKLEQGTKGTGLGLYISKAIVELHHGQIWVNSEVGKGSVFSFSLPTYDPNRLPQAQSFVSTL